MRSPLPSDRESLRSKAATVLKYLISVVIWIAVWQWVALRLNRPLLLPTPYRVFCRLIELMGTKVFWKHTAFSLLRVLAGIGTGTCLAVLTAVATYRFSPLKILLDPLITVIKTVPVSSFIILAMLWINRNLIPIFIAFLMVFPVIWANVCEGLQSVPPAFLELSRVYRFGAVKKIRRLYLPVLAPYFLSACRSSLGFAWKAGIAAEVLALPVYAIGKQLYESKLYLETTDLFAWTTVVIILSLALERLAKLLIRKMTKFTHTERGGAAHDRF